MILQSGCFTQQNNTRLQTPNPVLEELMSLQIKVPVLPESVADATMLDWRKSVGDQVERDEIIVEVETDKVVLEVPTPEAGVLIEIVKQPGDIVLAGEVIARIDSTAGASASTAEPVATTVPAATVAAATVPAATAAVATIGEDRFGPAVRRLVIEHGLDADKIPATGKDGRITKEDVLNYFAQQAGPGESVEQASAGDAPAPTPAVASPAIASTATDSNASRPQRRESMSRLRKTIARRLVESQQSAALLTTFNEVDLHEIKKLRAAYKEPFAQQHGVKLGFMSFFVKAATEALKRYPLLNAQVDGDDIVYNDYFDIGIAVSSPRGLVVPVLRGADEKTFAQIEQDISRFGQKARDRSLAVDELMGGTFTITNGGVFGSMLSTPIINPPQSAILGMHNIKDRPVVVNGGIVVRPMMYLAVSYDHRIIDGKDAVQFLVYIKEALEDPARLLLSV